MAWRVDISEAPKGHPDLVGAIEDVQEKLADPNFVKSLCVHESAHAVYWSFLDRATTPDYTIRIHMDSSGTRCIVEYAAMVLVNPAEPKEWTCLGLAKAHAAGGVASEILAPGYERGDLEDFENFRRDILVVTTATLDQLKETWEAARQEIKKELRVRNSAIRAEIERRAIDFETGLRLVSGAR